MLCNINRVYALARMKKKIVPLQTAFGVEFVRLKATIGNNHRKTT